MKSKYLHGNVYCIMLHEKNNIQNFIYIMKATIQTYKVNTLMVFEKNIVLGWYYNLIFHFSILYIFHVTIT